MTVINLSTEIDAILGTARADGIVTATPWAGDKMSPARINGEHVVFPEALNFKIDRDDTDPHIIIPPNPAIYCWRIMIAMKGKDPVLWFVNVPDVEEVDFGDLERVDPNSFLPLPFVPPTVQELIAEAEELYRDILKRTVTATVDPANEDVLILEFPSYMTDPENELILVLPLEGAA